MPRKSKKEVVNQEVIEQEVVNQVEEVVETQEVATEEVTEETPKENKKKKEKKVSFSVPQMNNSEMSALFSENGCATYTKAKDTSNVVYNTFGTKSRILQQNKAYQLLLTNGHAKVKNEVVETENNDVERFKEFYNELQEDEKLKVSGFDTMESTKLASSELPRERTVKILDKDVLIKFIQFMSTFEENKVVVAE